MPSPPYRTTALALAIALAIALPACGALAVYDTPVPTDPDAFTAATPDPDALKRYQLADAWSRDHEGLALLVFEEGRLVFESYAEGYDPQLPVHIFSGTKSFACALAVAAVADGKLDLDEPAWKTLGAWANDPLKTSITARHLLHLTSGLDDNFLQLTWDGLRKEQRVGDKATLAIDAEATDPPGARFRYGSVNFFAFAALLQERLAMNPLDWLKGRLLDPIGMRWAHWQRDPTGTPMLAYGLWTTAREWARFGLLILNDGAWKGHRLLPEGAFQACFHGSTAMPAYGLSFWLNAPVTAAQREDLPPPVRLGGDGPLLYHNAPADLVAAAGHNDNRLYIIPSRRLLIVRLGGGDSDFYDALLLARLLDGESPEPP